MGKAVQTQDYVIVFTASWETFEDTLLFFHNDFQEALLRWHRQPCGIGRAVGVHVSQLNDDLSFHECFVIQNNALHTVRSDQAIRPALVHLLHFGEEHEIAAHRRLAQQFEHAAIALINPYNEAVANCDSKYRMSEILREHGIATPGARFVSRFTEDKTAAFGHIRRQWLGKDVYVQPDRGTEATGCILLQTDEPAPDEIPEYYANRDVIVRERVGNLLYDGQNCVLRLNVTYDGKTFAADSGYCMVGGPVVSAAHGAVKQNINRVFDRLRLRQYEIEGIKTTACAAVRAVSLGSVAPRLAGVDLVLEKHDSVTPYVIDVNPRPVAVGSRMIDSNAIGLGDHYWSGIGDFPLSTNGNTSANSLCEQVIREHESSRIATYDRD